MRNFVQIVFAHPTNEAVVLQLILHSLHLVSEGTEGVNDETLDDGQQDDNDEEEEGDVEENTINLVFITIRRFNLITDTTASSNAFVQMEDEAGQHVVALLVNFLFFFRHVELPEEVEGDDGVDVHDNSQEHDGQHQLLAVVSDGLQNDPQGSNTDGNVKQMGSEEEVVVVAKQREDKVPKLVQEWLKWSWCSDEKSTVYDMI